MLVQLVYLYYTPSYDIISIKGGCTMGKTSTKSKQKYNAKAYDRIALNVNIGQREILKAYAESKGMSLNGYINMLIENDMKQG